MGLAQCWRANEGETCDLDSDILLITLKNILTTYLVIAADGRKFASRD